MENLGFNREHVLRREEPVLKMTKLIVGHPMKRRIRSTIAITCDLIEMMRLVMIVRS